MSQGWAHLPPRVGNSTYSTRVCCPPPPRPVGWGRVFAPHMGWGGLLLVGEQGAWGTQGGKQGSTGAKESYVAQVHKVGMVHRLHRVHRVCRWAASKAAGPAAQPPASHTASQAAQRKMETIPYACGAGLSNAIDVYNSFVQSAG